MKKLIIKCLFFLTFTTICNADDSDLVKFNSNEYQTIYGIKGTIVKNDVYRTIWTQGVYKLGGTKQLFAKYPELQPAAYNKQQWLFNCKTDMFVSLQFILYTNNGINIYTEGETNKLPVVPDSVGKVVRDVACYDYDETQKGTKL